IAYWAGVGPAAVRSLIRALQSRASALELHVTGLEASTLIELTAFGTAVLLHWRYTRGASRDAEPLESRYCTAARAPTRRRIPSFRRSRTRFARSSTSQRAWLSGVTSAQ